ncbi:MULTISPECIES: hypothetical protein [Psychrilyobacter]|uniref:Uncharacterized protein n=1 Tax=Psychrilyobacter piezotolerans TaxID=2293438 RepID=A0ABX9KDW2_9FUSO|nr:MULTISPECIES: hypothetical protein [Psychrilyobacter]MCS5421925.1 hypothetical protein [Psychrilyobacter sp. S5]NDI78943.1 hypothetical protein [Psychrilyobacter piezotolerans]RDE59236.1 hypothetical protein DV867_13285 [Psychrilyobacter sp. S5]REI39796.1 hypothetical protein DYH56_13285 [Psychrilyobacter piezotolerans]
MESKKPIEIPETFKMALMIVTGLTVLSILIAITLAFIATPNDMQKDLYKVATFGWQSGFGCMVGLVGGKVAN